MGFKEKVGITVSDEEAVARVVTDEDSANEGGAVQGGLLATLLDVAMGRAVRLGSSDDEKVVTVQLSITYLNAAKPGDELVARAEVLKRSSSLAIITAKITRASDDEQIADGQATFAISKSDD